MGSCFLVLPVEQPFPPPFLFPSASYCKLSGSRQRQRKTENYCMHVDNLAPLSQCSCGPVPVCVCQTKEEQKTRREGSFQVFTAFCALQTVPNLSSPRGPRCSVPLVNLRDPSTVPTPKRKRGVVGGLHSSVCVRAGSLSGRQSQYLFAVHLLGCPPPQMK